LLARIQRSDEEQHQLVPEIQPPPVAPQKAAPAEPEQPMDEGEEDEEDEEDEPVGPLASSVRVVVDGEMRIRKDHQAPTADSHGAKSQGAQVVIDPITGQQIRLDEVQEHMKVQLMDPMWKEKKQMEDAKKKVASSLDNNSNIAKNLSRLSKKRSDIFMEDDEGEDDAQEAAKKRRMVMTGFEAGSAMVGGPKPSAGPGVGQIFSQPQGPSSTQAQPPPGSFQQQMQQNQPPPNMGMPPGMMGGMGMPPPMGMPPGMMGGMPPGELQFLAQRPFYCTEMASTEANVCVMAYWLVHADLNFVWCLFVSTAGLWWTARVPAGDARPPAWNASAWNAAAGIRG